MHIFDFTLISFVNHTHFYDSIIIVSLNEFFLQLIAWFYLAGLITKKKKKKPQKKEEEKNDEIDIISKYTEYSVEDVKKAESPSCLPTLKKISINFYGEISIDFELYECVALNLYILHMCVNSC